jgi:hypothetical protein
MEGNRGKFEQMDRLGSFFLGLVAGAILALGIKKLMDDKDLSLESLEETIEDRLDALEGHFGEPVLN